MFAKLEKNSVKQTVNPYKKSYVNPFEIYKSDIALATHDFLWTDSDHDDNKQDVLRF